MADEPNPQDKLAAYRQKTSDLIAELSTYTDTANSDEMAQVQRALAYLGRAYLYLMPSTPDVPSPYGY